METLENYKLIKTDDGSMTLYSKKYGEACHSTSGAREETRVHYIQGCEIEKLAQHNDEISILEVGFGTGIGFDETIKICKKYNCKLNFYSFEIDQALVDYFYQNNKWDNEKYKLNVLIGNARHTIKTLIENNLKFDGIYQDAFSPKRNSILWTTEWFTELKSLAHDHCILSTYSASSSIRKSMLAAGWAVFNGVKFGPKRSSTRCKLVGETEPEILSKLERSPAKEITDLNYFEYKMDTKNVWR